MEPIELPFTRDSVIRVLTSGAHPDNSRYSHKQIAEWCDRFWCQYLDVDAEPAIEQLLPVLTDVETQWDLYLANTYSIEELRSRSFDDEKMPLQPTMPRAYVQAFLLEGGNSMRRLTNNLLKLSNYPGPLGGE